MLYAPASTFSFPSLRGFTRSNPVVSFGQSQRTAPTANRPISGLLRPSMLRQASRFTPFSPDGFPARKAHGAS
ncbi:MAG: hypothetical protein LBL79_13450 [Prevotella sp.]|nr:hypothetical protein [Prevotella sp.]